MVRGDQRGKPEPLRKTSLENQDEGSWRRHGQLAYLFARHVRHDMMNIAGALTMLEAVQRAQEKMPSAKPPPDLEPAQVKIKMQRNIRHLISVGNDLVLLSQGACRAAYQPPHAFAVRELIDEAVGSRLKAGDARPTRLLEIPQSQRVLTLGDMLQAAVAAFYFQWTPWYHEHCGAAKAWFRGTEEEIELVFPADDTEIVGAFARRLRQDEETALAEVIEKALCIATAELALWMARFIVGIHGGRVHVDVDDPELAVHVRLPLIP
jgi:hypothetical protein